MGEVRFMISEAAKQVNVESHVLRYWEEELDLTIGRTEMGHRYYTKDDIQLFCCIKKLKNEGMLLKDLKPLIPELKEKKSKLKTPEKEKTQLQTVTSETGDILLPLNTIDQMRALVGDVFRDGAAAQPAVLQDDGQATPEAVPGVLLDGQPVNGDRAALGCIESQQEGDQGGLAGPGFPHHHNDLMLPHRRQNVVPAAGNGEVRIGDVHDGGEKKTLQERPAGLMEKPERISLLPGFGKGDAAAPGQHLHVVILNERQEAVNLVLTARHFNGQGVPRDVHDAGAQDLAEFNDFMPRSGIHADAGQYRFPVHVVRVAEIHYFHRVDEFFQMLDDLVQNILLFAYDDGHP